MATLNKNDKDFLPKRNTANPTPTGMKIPKSKDLIEEAIKDKTKDPSTYIFVNENTTDVLDDLLL